MVLELFVESENESRIEQPGSPGSREKKPTNYMVKSIIIKAYRYYF